MPCLRDATAERARARESEGGREGGSSEPLNAVEAFDWEESWAPGRPYSQRFYWKVGGDSFFFAVGGSEYEV